MIIHRYHNRLCDVNRLYYVNRQCHVIFYSYLTVNTSMTPLRLMDRQRYRLLNLGYALERIDRRTRRSRDESLFLSMPCTNFALLLYFHCLSYVICVYLNSELLRIRCAIVGDHSQGATPWFEFAWICFLFRRRRSLTSFFLAGS